LEQQLPAALRSALPVAVQLSVVLEQQQPARRRLVRQQQRRRRRLARRLLLHRRLALHLLLVDLGRQLQHNSR
jgi:hypothetical protein